MSAGGPPPGWVPMDGLLKPGGSVLDYAARGQPSLGGCAKSGCKRSLRLDPREMSNEGLGRIAMIAVQRLFRCNRLGGCGLTFRDGEMQNEPSLSSFEGRPCVRIRVKCQADRCKFFRVWRVEEMERGLVKRGKGNGFTRISELAPLMTEPCPLCRKVRWAVDVLWANTDSALWRGQGEAIFDDRARWERA